MEHAVADWRKTGTVGGWRCVGGHRFGLRGNFAQWRQDGDRCWRMVRLEALTQDKDVVDWRKSGRWRLRGHLKAVR